MNLEFMKKKRIRELTADTGFTLADWRALSARQVVCGILGCDGEPTVQCNHCGNYYCEEHKWVMDIPVHHPMP